MTEKVLMKGNEAIAEAKGEKIPGADTADTDTA